MDGLTAYTLAGHLGPDDALTAFDRHLERLFPGDEPSQPAAADG